MAQTIQRKTIVVLGSGRSGTSLLMEVLAKLGMSTSKDLVLPSEQNPHGGFEDTEIFSLQNKLLNIISTTTYIPLPDDWLNLPGVSIIGSELENIAQERLQQAETIWGFKDPKTSLFLPIWTQIFNKLKIVPIYVLTLRHPAQVVLSMKKQYNTSESQSELFWLNKNVESLRHTSAGCYIAHYEDWFTRGEEMAEELLEYTGLDAFFQGKSVAEDLQGVVKQNLNRSIYEDYEVQNEYLLKLYESLKQCRGKDFDRVKLMQTVNTCRKAMHSFRGWYEHAQTLQSREGKLAEKAKRNTDLEREMSKYKSDLDTQQKKIKELTSKYKSDLDTKQKKIKELNADLEDMVLDNNRLLIENKDLFEINENYRKRKSKERSSVQSWKREVIKLKNSSSYRLGLIFVMAFREPGKKTLLVPYYFLRLVWDIATNRDRNKVRKDHKHNSR